MKYKHGAISQDHGNGRPRRLQARLHAYSLHFFICHVFTVKGQGRNSSIPPLEIVSGVWPITNCNATESEHNFNGNTHKIFYLSIRFNDGLTWSTSHLYAKRRNNDRGNNEKENRVLARPHFSKKVLRCVHLEAVRGFTSLVSVCMHTRVFPPRLCPSPCF